MKTFWARWQDACQHDPWCETPLFCFFQHWQRHPDWYSQTLRVERGKTTVKEEAPTAMSTSQAHQSRTHPQSCGTHKKTKVKKLLLRTPPHQVVAPLLPCAKREGRAQQDDWRLQKDTLRLQPVPRSLPTTLATLPRGSSAPLSPLRRNCTASTAPRGPPRSPGTHPRRAMNIALRETPQDHGCTDKWTEMKFPP